MKISRIQIENFRNFSALDVVVDGNVVIVGENRVGKSNLLFALRLVLDPTLPDSARQLSRSDFWDGLSRIDKNTRIRIALEIADFENDEDVLCTLTDYRTVADATKARLTYEYRSNAKLAGEPKSDDDYEFVCFGGEKETQRFGHDLRRRLPMDWLPALRDAEGDLGSWRRSPLRPLIDDATRGIDADTLAAISNLIQEATGKLIEEDALKDLEAGIGRQFADMSGTRQDVKPRLGFNPTEPASLYRTIRLLIDEGKRGISDASLGSANLMYLTLKLLELKRYIDENRRDHTLLSVEEPEAHLHPHLQRSVYRHLFSSVLSSTAISVLLTTHSPHIVSVAPLSSIVLLKDQPGKGTTGVSAASINLTEEESHDLQRYLDVTRAEILFARGVILVEGDAERFLLPTFAAALAIDLDHHGISICSVAGTHFNPYVKFLEGLQIPFVVLTDMDPMEGKEALGVARAKGILSSIASMRDSQAQKKLIGEIGKTDANSIGALAAGYGCFLNAHTLEVDLFLAGFHEVILHTLAPNFGPDRKKKLNDWNDEPRSLETDAYLAMITEVGKGRFAQQLASMCAGIRPPDYIANAIAHLVKRVQ